MDKGGPRISAPGDCLLLVDQAGLSHFIVVLFSVLFLTSIKSINEHGQWTTTTTCDGSSRLPSLHCLWLVLDGHDVMASCSIMMPCLFPIDPWQALLSLFFYTSRLGGRVERM